MQAAAEPKGQGRLSETWFVLVAGFSVLAAQNAALIIPPLLVEMSTDLEISVAVAGQLATATFAAWAVCVVTAGPLSDSFGRRPIALAGLAVLVASVTASAFAPNLATLVVLRVLTGLGGGMLPPNGVGAISEVVPPERRARAVGLFMSFQVLSVGAAAFVALLAGWGGWRFAFLVSGLILAASLLSNWIWFPRDSRERVRNLEFYSRFRDLLTLRFFQVAVSANLTVRIAYWGFFSYYAAFLIDTYDISLEFSAVPLAIAAVAQIAGSYVAPMVGNIRTYPVMVALTALAGGVCGLLFFAFDLGFWAAVAVASVGTGLLSMTFPSLVAVSTHHSGNSTATGVGLMGLSNMGGGVIGAALAGYLLSSTGFGGIGYLCLGVTVASVLSTLFFRRQ